VAASGGLSLPGGSGSLISRDNRTFVQLSSFGGSVGRGSFANSGATSITTTSTEDMTQLEAQCRRGLSHVAFTGTVMMASTPVQAPTFMPMPPPGAPAVYWSAMANDLGLFPDTVACPSTTLCVFAGATTGTGPGTNLTVSASTGPFVPGRTITGHLIVFSQPGNPAVGTGPQLSCPSITMCMLLTPTGIYATASPLTGPWVLEFAAPPGDDLASLSCATATFCAAIVSIPDVVQGSAASDVLITTRPLGGQSTWSSRQVIDGDYEVSTISCSSPEFCVAGGGYGETGSWIATSSDPTGGSSAWTGGPIASPEGAVHSGEYLVVDLGCPTSTLCVGDLVDNQLEVSADPAGGPQTWHIVSGTYQADGVAWCKAGGRCVVSDVGTFPSDGGAPGQVVGDSPTLVSCVTVSFCVSVDESSSPPSLEVGRVTDSPPKTRPPTLAPISHPTTAGTFGRRPPKITVGSGAPPVVLEGRDLITGTGRAVELGDTVTVQYVEISYTTPWMIGQTTWGQMPYSFTVGEGGVIAGWDEGMIGMKVGGRRELIIPPTLAYAGISDATVVLVVDLLRISTTSPPPGAQVVGSG
jgi:peptidylprolyl isomerase